MTLNKGKCLTITMNGHSHTQFQDETQLTNVTHAKYLGITLDERASNKPDLNARLTATMATVATPKNMWKSSAAPKWEILVFNTVVGSKILYGLESLQMTAPDYRRLDAFQQRGLRRTLGILPSHLDRIATNKFVLEAAEKKQLHKLQTH